MFLPSHFYVWKFFAHSWFQNLHAQTPQDLQDSESIFIWPYKDWNRSHEHCTTSTVVETELYLIPCSEARLYAGPPRQWKRLYLIFPALKQEFTSIAQPLQLSKLNFNTFLVSKHDCTTSTGPPQPWKQLHLILPPLKQKSVASCNIYSCWN